MTLKKRSTGTFRFIVPIVIVVICFVYNSGYTQQQSASVAIEFELIPLGVLAFEIDGTDVGLTRSTNETCDLGIVDNRGTPISGAPVGEPNVNGVVGIPVDSTGVPLASFEDAGCIGAFYPLFAAAGGNTNTLHPNCALLIRLQSNSAWMFTCQAQMINSTTQVTVDQLKWKMDAAASNGFQNYTNFSSAVTTISSGDGAVNTRYYMDYGLLVDNADAPGTNSWLVTYTLTSNL